MCTAKLVGSLICNYLLYKVICSSSDCTYVKQTWVFRDTLYIYVGRTQRTPREVSPSLSCSLPPLFSPLRGSPISAFEPSFSITWYNWVFSGNWFSVILHVHVGARNCYESRVHAYRMVRNRRKRDKQKRERRWDDTNACEKEIQEIEECATRWNLRKVLALSFLLIFYLCRGEIFSTHCVMICDDTTKTVSRLAQQLNLTVIN